MEGDQRMDGGGKGRERECEGSLDVLFTRACLPKGMYVLYNTPVLIN